jgi:hypothetical protein
MQYYYWLFHRDSQLTVSYFCGIKGLLIRLGGKRACNVCGCSCCKVKIAATMITRGDLVIRQLSYMC